MAQKIGILAADSVLIPIIIGKGDGTASLAFDASNQATSLNQEVRQVFLVHLQVRKTPVAVTVYTSREAAGEENTKAMNSENDDEKVDDEAEV